MYPKAKILSEEEYQAWKKEDEERNRHKSLISPHKSRGMFFEPGKTAKKQQRNLNANIKLLNKQMEDDFLWRGRFFVRQSKAIWREFEDRSGGDLYVYLRFYDKKDNVYIETFATARTLCFGNHSVFWLMNKAVTEIFKVWPGKDDNLPSPYEDRMDYRCIPSDYTIKNAEPLCSEFNYFGI